MQTAVIGDPANERQQWSQLVSEFCDQVRGWAEEAGWQVTRKTLDRTEEVLGTYEVPMLIIQTATRAVMVEPVARMIMGATGRIDVYAYPTLFRVMLLRSGASGEWRIRTDSGFFLPQSWSKETFVTLVGDLAGAG